MLFCVVLLAAFLTFVQLLLQPCARGITQVFQNFKVLFPHHHGQLNARSGSVGTTPVLAGKVTSSLAGQQTYAISALPQAACKSLVVVGIRSCLDAIRHSG